MNKIVTLIFAGVCLASCSDNAIDKKGIQVNEIVEDENGKKIIGLNIDSLQLETRPNGVLLTNNAAHRITPIFKVNYTKKDNEPFIGSNKFHTDWEYEYESGNNWHQNIVPGFEALYGYNLVNISHYNNQTKTENKLFDKPVLIKTVYYPTFAKDSLNFEPVNRTYFLVSVYDEDSNKDGFINAKDLRRFYYFDIEGKNKSSLIPKNYAVVGSDYDSGNDFMYVFAKIDKNKNGKIDANEPMDIFWIDLKNPENNGIQFQSE